MNKIKVEILKSLKSIIGHYASEKVWSSDEIKISEQAVGGKVEIVNPDGSLTDAPDGDYVMDNGFSFTVKDSMISVIEGEAPEQGASGQPANEGDKSKGGVVEENPGGLTQAATDNVDTPAKEETPEEEKTETPDFEALEERVITLEQTVADMQAVIEGLKTAPVAATKEDVDSFSKEVSDLHATIKQLAKVPVEFSKTTQNNTVKESKEDKLLQLARIMGKK